MNMHPLSLCQSLLAITNEGSVGQPSNQPWYINSCPGSGTHHELQLGSYLRYWCQQQPNDCKVWLVQQVLGLNSVWTGHVNGVCSCTIIRRKGESILNEEGESFLDATWLLVMMLSLSFQNQADEICQYWSLNFDGTGLILKISESLDYIKNPGSCWCTIYIY